MPSNLVVVLFSGVLFPNGVTWNLDHSFGRLKLTLALHRLLVFTALHWLCINFFVGS